MLQETNTYTESFRLFDLDYWPPAFKRLKVLQSLIELDFRYNRDISVYAVKMDTSIHALNRFAKAYLGRSVYELLQDRIYREALYLLQYTRHSVKEISELLGFCDSGYFCRWFKQRNGETAKGYRASLRHSVPPLSTGGERASVIDHPARWAPLLKGQEGK